MIQGVLTAVVRLPLLFRGDLMRPSSAALLAVVTPLLLVYLALKVRSGMRLRTAFAWAFLAVYAAWAAGLLFGAPRAFAADPYLAGGLSTWINVVPFATIASQARLTSGSAAVQLIGNVGLLLPLGLVGPAVVPALRRAPRLALAALGVSVGIELVQFVATTLRFIDRSVDIDDVILNVAGALLGWLLWRAITVLRDRMSQARAAKESL